MSNKVLVLDDDLQVRGSLVIHLEDEDYTVFEVGSSEEALEFLKTKDVALVIVDLRLPGMDGVEFIHSARVGRPTLKFIIYTGSPEFRIPAELATMKNVSNSVFLKPLSDLDVMTREIERMLSQE